MILATIILRQCDNCTALVAIKTVEDWRTFEKTWHTGERYDFCPECRHKIETQSCILEDETRVKKSFQVWFEDDIAPDKDAPAVSISRVKMGAEF